MISALFVDIETRRTADLEAIARLQAAVKPPANYKNADTIHKWWSEEGRAQQLKAAESTALDGTYGRVASIAWALGDDAAKCVYGDDEVGMLHAVSAVMSPQPEVVVAFNADFDFRFIYQRMVINKMQVPHALRRALRDRTYVYDPMREWAGFKGFIKQIELERALGIAREDELVGADVGLAIDAGDWAAVERHNVADVENLQEIYRRMNRGWLA